MDYLSSVSIKPEDFFFLGGGNPSAPPLCMQLWHLYFKWMYYNISLPQDIDWSA